MTHWTFGIKYWILDILDKNEIIYELVNIKIIVNTVDLTYTISLLLIFYPGSIQGTVKNLARTVKYDASILLLFRSVFFI